MKIENTSCFYPLAKCHRRCSIAIAVPFGTYTTEESEGAGDSESITDARDLARNTEAVSGPEPKKARVEQKPVGRHTRRGRSPVNTYPKRNRTNECILDDDHQIPIGHFALGLKENAKDIYDPITHWKTLPDIGQEKCKLALDLCTEIFTCKHI